MSEGLKKWYPALSTGVAVLFLVLWLGCCGEKTVVKASDDHLLREQIANREATIREKDAIIATISKKLSTDSLKHLEVTTGLKQRETVLVRKLKEANADIKQIADSLPRVRRYVELADSTISIKDSLYTVEVNHGLALDSLYRIEIAALADKNVVQKQVSELQATKIIALEKDKDKLERKLNRKKTGNKLLAGLAAGLAAALGVVIITSQ